METPRDDHETRPIYQVGDGVLRTSVDFSFKGKISQVIPPNEVAEMLDYFLENYPEDEVRTVMETYRSRDQEFADHPMYVMIPEGCDKPASFEQAKCIIPGITKQVYDRLMKPRHFLVLESDIVPLDWVE